MDEPGHGILGREAELAQVRSFLGSVSEGAEALLLEGAAGIGKRSSALDAALLRAEVEGAPPDQRAVSVASLGVLRTLAAAGPVVVAIDDARWLDAPSARVLAFVVRRLEDAPVRRRACTGCPLARWARRR